MLWTCPPKPCGLSSGMTVSCIGGAAPPGLTFIFVTDSASLALELCADELSNIQTPVFLGNESSNILMAV